jgi:transcriptional regulator with XRE-family HTH domain
MRTTGNILKELRLNKKITLEQLAAEMNKKFDVKLTGSMICKWETDKAVPVYTHLKHLALYYNVSTDYLLDFNQEKEELSCDLEANNKNLAIPRKLYTLEKVVKFLNDDRFTNKDIKFIGDFIQLYAEKIK